MLEHSLLVSCWTYLVVRCHRQLWREDVVVNAG